MKKTIITISLSLLFTTYVVTTPPSSNRIIPVGFIIDSMSNKDREKLKKYMLVPSPSDDSLAKWTNKVFKLLKKQGYPLSQIDGDGGNFSQDAWLAKIESANEKHAKALQQQTFCHNK